MELLTEIWGDRSLMIQICSTIRLFGSIQDAIACALLWWRLADGDLWFESSTTESVCARPTDLRRPRGYWRRKKRDPNLHRTWSNRAGSCKAEEMLTPRVHFWVCGVGGDSQIEKVVMSFDISNQVRPQWYFNNVNIGMHSTLHPNFLISQNENLNEIIDLSVK